MKSLFIFIVIIFTNSKLSYSQCIVDAGEDKYVCVDKCGIVDTTELNGSITSGIPPYAYKWEANYAIGLQTLTASSFLDDTTKLNPLIVNEGLSVSSGEPLIFNLTVTDNFGNTCSDSTKVVFSHFGCLPDLRERIINLGDSVQIYSYVGNGIPPLNFKWYPNYNISDTTINDPVVWPNTTTVYNVIVTDSIGCINTFLTDWTIYVNSTSINKVKNTSCFRISSNPILIESVLDINKAYYNNELRIYDIKGKLVWRKKMIIGSIPIGEIIKQSGTYLIVFLDKKGIIASEKLLKL